jgi:alpha-mannosidase
MEIGLFFAIKRIRRILEELQDHIFQDAQPLELKMQPCGYGDYEMLHQDDANWEDFPQGGRWGGYDVHCWFRSRFTVPERYEGKPVMLRVSTGRTGWCRFVNDVLHITKSK